MKPSELDRECLEMWWRQGRIRELKQALSKIEHPKTHERLLQLISSQMFLDEALEQKLLEVTASVSTLRDKALACVALADFYSQLGDLKEASVHVHSLNQLFMGLDASSPIYWDLARLHCEIAMSTNDWRQKRVALDHLIKIGEDHHFDLGICGLVKLSRYLATHNNDKDTVSVLLSIFDRIRCNPQLEPSIYAVTAHLYYAQILESELDYESARAHYAKAIWGVRRCVGWSVQAQEHMQMIAEASLRAGNTHSTRLWAKRAIQIAHQADDTSTVSVWNRLILCSLLADNDFDSAFTQLHLMLESFRKDEAAGSAVFPLQQALMDFIASDGDNSRKDEAKRILTRLRLRHSGVNHAPILRTR